MGLSRKIALLGVVRVAATALILLAWAGEVRGAGNLKIAAVFGTAIEEPWVQRIHGALQAASEGSGIPYQWSDQVAPADFGPALQHYAEQGYGLIVADSFAAEEQARRIAKAYPETTFLFGSGGGPAAPNVSVFDNWVHEPAFLAGMIAGGLTVTDRIGAVAAMPIPEINRLVNAFCLGAREVNPGVRCMSAFIDTFFDPARARAAAMVQIDQGADVIYAERLGAIEAAAERGIAAIGNLADQAALAPDTVVTSVVWDLAPTLAHVLAGLETGTMAADDLGRFAMMRHGGAALAPYGRWADRLPADLKERVAKRHQAILEGTFRVIIDESEPRAD